MDLLFTAFIKHSLRWRWFVVSCFTLRCFVSRQQIACCWRFVSLLLQHSSLSAVVFSKFAGLISFVVFFLMADFCHLLKLCFVILLSATLNIAVQSRLATSDTVCHCKHFILLLLLFFHMLAIALLMLLCVGFLQQAKLCYWLSLDFRRVAKRVWLLVGCESLMLDHGVWYVLLVYDMYCRSYLNADRPLINVWIPSAFLHGSQHKMYHVYQVICLTYNRPLLSFLKDFVLGSFTPGKNGFWKNWQSLLIILAHFIKHRLEEVISSAVKKPWHKARFRTLLSCVTDVWNYYFFIVEGLVKLIIKIVKV